MICYIWLHYNLFVYIYDSILSLLEFNTWIICRYFLDCGLSDMSICKYCYIKIHIDILTLWNEDLSISRVCYIRFCYIGVCYIIIHIVNSEIVIWNLVSWTLIYYVKIYVVNSNSQYNVREFVICVRVDYKLFYSTLLEILLHELWVTSELIQDR